MQNYSRKKIKVKIMNTSKLTFIKHTGNVCPIPMDSVVVYRTTSPENFRSHVHVAASADVLTWDDSAHMGRIYEYAIIK